MFFNLKKLPDSVANIRTPDFYLEHVKGTLCLKYPMVIFCDSETKSLIQPIRERLVGDSAPSVYVVRDLIEYDYYKKFYSTIEANRAGNNFYVGNPKHNVSYLLSMMFKFEALQLTYLRNDFNTSHYVWIDIGGSRVFGPNMESDAKALLDSPKDKVGACYVHCRSHEQLLDMHKYCDEGWAGIAGGVFSVEKSYVSKLYTLAWGLFYEMLDNRCGHSDEQVLTYCYDRSPEIFNIYYGDYTSLLSNYHMVKGDFHTIFWYFIVNAKNIGRMDLAFDAAQQCYIALLSGRITMGDDRKKDLEEILGIK